MCEIYDDGERCAVWNERTRTARKEHRCSTCRGVIAAGAKYVHHSSMYDGHWSKERSCLQCDDARERFGEEHKLTPQPSAFVDCLIECIEEGQAEARRWGPTLSAIRGRRPAETKGPA